MSKLSFNIATNPETPGETQPATRNPPPQGQQISIELVKKSSIGFSIFDNSAEIEKKVKPSKKQEETESKCPKIEKRATTPLSFDFPEQRRFPEIFRRKSKHF